MASTEATTMSETAPSASQTTGKSFVPEASADVLFERKIDFQPCCLQFSLKSPKHLVVGTYNLEDPTTQSRNGSLLLYVLRNDKLILVDTFVHTSGILDIQFNLFAERTEKFAIASSSGSISIFKLKGTNLAGDDGNMAVIVHLNTFQVFSETTVITSLAWHKGHEGPLAITTSKGNVSILSFRNNYSVLHEQTIVNSHQGYEAWTVAFGLDRHQRSGGLFRQFELEDPVGMMPDLPGGAMYGVYSGGDDSRLRLVKFDRDPSGRTLKDPDFEQVDPNGLPGHNAGITAILPLLFLKVQATVGKEILVTGSYDDYVRVYAMCDYRYSAPDEKPAILAELNIGGGVWRLTFLEDYRRGNRRADHPKDQYVSSSMPDTAFRILASCMQGGARVLEILGSLRGEWSIRVLAELKFNTSNDLVYAGAVQPTADDEVKIVGENENNDEEKYTIVSGNFYEKQLCVWRYYKPASPLSPKSIYLKSRNTMYGLDEDENNAGQA